MTAHPFAISAPAVLTLQPDSAGTFQVTNAGSQPLTIHEAPGRYTDSAVRYPAASHATLTALGQPWIVVTPQTFTLRPGQHETVRISDHVPAGVHGDHFLSAVWTARPAHVVAGNLHLTGAVATSVRVPLAGVAVAVTGHGMPHAPAAPAHGGGPLGLMLWAVLAVAVLAAAGMVLGWRHRPRGAAA